MKRVHPAVNYKKRAANYWKVVDGKVQLTSMERFLFKIKTPKSVTSTPINNPTTDPIATTHILNNTLNQLNDNNDNGNNNDNNDLISIIHSLDDKLKSKDKIIEYVRNNNINITKFLEFSKKTFGQDVAKYFDNKKLTGPSMRIHKKICELSISFNEPSCDILQFLLEKKALILHCSDKSIKSNQLTSIIAHSSSDNSSCKIRSSNILGQSYLTFKFRNWSCIPSEIQILCTHTCDIRIYHYPHNSGKVIASGTIKNTNKYLSIKINENIALKGFKIGVRAFVWKVSGVKIYGKLIETTPTNDNIFTSKLKSSIRTSTKPHETSTCTISTSPPIVSSPNQLLHQTASHLHYDITTAPHDIDSRNNISSASTTSTNSKIAELELLLNQHSETINKLVNKQRIIQTVTDFRNVFEDKIFVKQYAAAHELSPFLFFHCANDKHRFTVLPPDTIKEAGSFITKTMSWVHGFLVCENECNWRKLRNSASMHIKTCYQTKTDASFGISVKEKQIRAAEQQVRTVLFALDSYKGDKWYTKAAVDRTLAGLQQGDKRLSYQNSKLIKQKYLLPRVRDQHILILNTPKPSTGKKPHYGYTSDKMTIIRNMFAPLGVFLFLFGVKVLLIIDVIIYNYIDGKSKCTGESIALSILNAFNKVEQTTYTINNQCSGSAFDGQYFWLNIKKWSKEILNTNDVHIFIKDFHHQLERVLAYVRDNYLLAKECTIITAGINEQFHFGKSREECKKLAKDIGRKWTDPTSYSTTRFSKYAIRSNKAVQDDKYVIKLYVAAQRTSKETSRMKRFCLEMKSLSYNCFSLFLMDLLTNIGKPAKIYEAISTPACYLPSDSNKILIVVNEMLSELKKIQQKHVFKITPSRSKLFQHFSNLRWEDKRWKNGKLILLNRKYNPSQHVSWCCVCGRGKRTASLLKCKECNNTVHCNIECGKISVPNDKIKDIINFYCSFCLEKDPTKKHEIIFKNKKKKKKKDKQKKANLNTNPSKRRSSSKRSSSKRCLSPAKQPTIQDFIDKKKLITSKTTNFISNDKYIPYHMNEFLNDAIAYIAEFKARYEEYIDIPDMLIKLNQCFDIRKHLHLSDINALVFSAIGNESILIVSKALYDADPNFFTSSISNISIINEYNTFKMIINDLNHGNIPNIEKLSISCANYKKLTRKKIWRRDLEVYRIIDITPKLFKQIPNVWRIFDWQYAIPSNEAILEGVGSKLGNRNVFNSTKDAQYVANDEVCAAGLPGQSKHRSSLIRDIAEDIIKDNNGPLFVDDRSTQKWNYNEVVDKIIRIPSPVYEHLENIKK